MQPDISKPALILCTGATVTAGNMISVVRSMGHFGGLVNVEGGPDMAFIRNKAVELFLQGPFQRALWVDSDIVFSPEDVSGFLDVEADVAVGVYRKHHADETMVTAGMGFTLTSREAIEATAPDYFANRKVGFDDSPETGQQSEDASFLWRVEQAGLTVKVTDIRVGHIKLGVV